jgi:hypothetical protein
MTRLKKTPIERIFRKVMDRRMNKAERRVIDPTGILRIQLEVRDAVNY